MIKIARMTPTIPRGAIIGKQTGGPPLSEAEHFWKCETCGGWSTCAISARCSTMRNRCRIPPAIRHNGSKKSGPENILPEARSHTARDVLVRPSSLHLAIVIGAVKKECGGKGRITATAA